jgi:hypothetical protein
MTPTFLKGSDAMSTTININKIVRLDHTIHAYNRSGGTPDGDRQQPLPVMPADRVTLSKEAWENNREEKTRLNDKVSLLHNRTGPNDSTGASQGKGARIDLSV